MNDSFQEIKNALKIIEDPIARADLLRNFIRDIYQFVKFNRPEGEGLDGRDGLERKSIGKILDESEEHYYRMISIYGRDPEKGERLQAIHCLDEGRLTIDDIKYLENYRADLELQQGLYKLKEPIHIKDLFKK